MSHVSACSVTVRVTGPGPGRPRSESGAESGISSSQARAPSTVNEVGQLASELLKLNFTEATVTLMFKPDSDSEAVSDSESSPPAGGLPAARQ